MHLEGETDFARIAAELRLEAERAARAASVQPDRSEELRRKARDLTRAADCIEQDANARQGQIVIQGDEER